MREGGGWDGKQERDWEKESHFCGYAKTFFFRALFCDHTQQSEIGEKSFRPPASSTHQKKIVRIKEIQIKNKYFAS